jgi:hypothetical protein
MAVTIHRRTKERPTHFEYNGELYYAHRMGPYGSGDDCWDVYRERDIASVGQFWRLDDIRALLNEAEQKMWPDLIELSDEELADFAMRGGND